MVPTVHLLTSGDILDGPGMLLKSYKAQDSPHNKELSGHKSQWWLSWETDLNRNIIIGGEFINTAKGSPE